MKISKLIAIITTAMFALIMSVMAALAVTAVAKSAVNVRSGPGTGYNKVGILLAGETVNVTQCQGNWCYVEKNGPDGWVSGKYLAQPSGSSSAASDAFMNMFGAIVGGILTPPPPPPTSTPTLPYGPEQCKVGFVWREAIPGDKVCVTPASRTLAANENAVAGSRVDPAGAHGPNTCISGYVWREAYVGDVVCVIPARRTQVRNENIQGPSNRELAS